MTQPFDKKDKSHSEIPLKTMSGLKKRQDFLRLAAGRKKWVSKSMIVQVADMPVTLAQAPSDIRVGFTASKKVGNAIMRNRAKRRLREVVRKILPEYGKLQQDYVLIARTETLTTSFDQLIRDFKWCLKRLKQSTDQPSSPNSETKNRRKADSRFPKRGNM